MRALRGENAVTPIVSLSTHPRALLAVAAASFNEHPPPRNVCFSIKLAGKCARSLIHRGNFSREREKERKRWERRKREGEEGGERQEEQEGERVRGREESRWDKSGRY